MYGSLAPQWLNIYKLLIVVVIPACLMLVFNGLIFLTVRSSTHRVQITPTTATADHPKGNCKRLNARDASLLKHMVFLVAVFVIGWAPIYIVSIGNLSLSIPPWIYGMFQVFTVTSALILILDLFLYNHELRQYIREQCLKWTCVHVHH